MVALILNIVFAVLFGHVMKWAAHRRANLLWVGACNYGAGSALCLLLTALDPPRTAVGFTLLTGAWAGVCYLVSLLYYFAAVQRLGMGLATSAIRVSVALPVAAALIVWHERLSAMQAGGLLLVATALLLLGTGDLGFNRRGAVQMFGLILPLFLVTGCGQLAARIFSGGAPAANAYLYTAAVFAGAGISALVALAIRPERPDRQDLLIGVILGLNNTITNVSLLRALRELPSAVVFSVSSAASVALAAVTGVLFWRERMSQPAIAAIVAATIAVVALTL